MKSHHRTDRLLVVSILLVVLVAILLITTKSPRLNYEKDGNIVLTEIMDNNYYMNPDQVANGDANTTFVDLRNSGQFFVKHIEGALNMPLIKILDKENLELFDDESKTFVLYGENNLMANGPYLLLKQLGYENINVLVGGYSNYLNKGKSYPEYCSNFDEVEKAVYDLNAEVLKAGEFFIEKEAIFGNTESNAVKTTKIKKTSPVKKLIPVEEEEEEDEGC